MKKIFNKIFSHKKHASFMHADEVFMDSQNIPGFNMNQLEGVVEKSISMTTFFWVKVFVFLMLCIFITRLVSLQIISGKDYRTKAENNRLDTTPIFAERGVIYDKNEKPLAWNVLPTDKNQPFLDRTYISDPGFSHILGFIGYPAQDSSGNLWRENIVGKTGIEKAFNTELSGINGRKLYETNVHGDITTENMGDPAIPGKNITLTIDAGIQSELFKAIRDQSERLGFIGGAGVIMDVHTGEVIALVSYPEYDNNIMSKGTDKKTIADYKLSPVKPFINRAVSGLYTPGSIIKPYMGIAALQEGIITSKTSLYSSGRIIVPNRYDPSKPQVFRDWKTEGHGATNLSKAIAESVNTFFYAVGGGWGDQKGMGIDKINYYMNLFKLGDKVPFILPGSKNGTIPSQAWKKEKFKDGTWRLGDTYNTSIGQFGFQVGLLPVVRAVASIANNGTLINPILVKDSLVDKITIKNIEPEYYLEMRNSMRAQVTDGTGKLMNVPFVTVAGKSGTAQVGPNRRYMNSWITGFFPYEEPQYAFVIVLEQGPSTNQTGASAIMGRVLNWMNINTPEYFGREKIPTPELIRATNQLQIKDTEELPTVIDTVDQFYVNYNTVNSTDSLDNLENTDTSIIPVDNKIPDEVIPTSSNL